MARSRELPLKRGEFLPDEFLERLPGLVPPSRTLPSAPSQKPSSR